MSGRCKAGGACHSMAGCPDTDCPGHPGMARVDRLRERLSLRQEREEGLYVAMGRVVWALIFLVIFCVSYLIEEGLK